MTIIPRTVACLFAASLLIATACGDADVTGPEEADNLLVNAGFEVGGSTGRPAFWEAVNDDGSVTFTWSNDLPRSGSRSAAISPGTVTGRVYAWSQDVSATLEPDRALELTAWVRTRDISGGVVVFVRCFGESDAGPDQLCFETTETVDDLTGTLDWTRVDVPFVVPDGTTFLRVTAAVLGQAGAGTAWFDDLAVTPVPLSF